jgi:hypothetical protein
MKHKEIKAEILLVSLVALIISTVFLALGYVLDLTMIRYVAGIISVFTAPLIIFALDKE